MITPTPAEQQAATYQQVREIEEYAVSLMRQVAHMGYRQMQLLKGQGIDWTPEMEEKLQRLYDLSRGLSSWREKDLAALDVARIHLEQFGGSPHRKAKGLEMTARAIENKRKERR